MNLIEKVLQGKMGNKSLLEKTHYTNKSFLGGIKKFQKDNGLRVDGIMKPGGETEKKFNEVKEKTATKFEKSIYGLNAASQGFSLGFSDEIEGAINGFGHVIAKGADSIYSKIQPAISKKFPNAPKNIYYTDKGYVDAFKHGYKSQRDESRNLLEEGYRRVPIVTGAAEAAGAIASPIKFGKVSKTAPLTVKADKVFIGGIKSGTVYGIGTTNENKASEYAKNIGVSVVGNYLGNRAINSLYGRGANPIIRETINYGSGLGTNRIKNLLEKK